MPRIEPERRKLFGWTPTKRTHRSQDACTPSHGVEADRFARSRQGCLAERPAPPGAPFPHAEGRIEGTGAPISGLPEVALAFPRSALADLLRHPKEYGRAKRWLSRSAGGISLPRLPFEGEGGARGANASARRKRGLLR